MAKIEGVTGIFIRCRNVEAYRQWWQDHMDLTPTNWGTFEWDHSSGKVRPDRSMLSPFAEESDYFEPGNGRIIINLQTDDCAAMLKRAIAGGATPAGGPDLTEFGTFGWFIDPEGYKIELWEPPNSMK